MNLHLSVGAAGADGFHPIATVFQAVDLHEVVTATARDDSEIRLTVDAAPSLSGTVEANVLERVPLDQGNLAWQAALAVREHFGIDAGVDLHILKGVPVAGGMAGGSADAAAAVVACAELWDCGANRSELREICARLGSDVPFALMGHTAVGVGRGDVLTPAMARGEYHWVFAASHDGLATPDVFREFDRIADAGVRAVAAPQLNDAVMQALSAGDANALGAALSNDLQVAALSLAPRLERTMDSMRSMDALGVIVSGSGPTVAALARSRQHALAIAAHVLADGAADAAYCATGPSVGAAILDD